jgi:HEPN domain
MDDNGLKLRQIVGEWMEVIDHWLVQRNMPLSNRVFSACTLFAQHAIESFSNGAGEETDTEELRKHFPMSESFQGIYLEIQNWYKNRYGKALESASNWTVDGVVMFAGVMFQIAVPIIRREPSSSPNEAVAHFAEKIELGEDPLRWVIEPPNWNAFPNTDKQHAEDQAKVVASQLRRIRIYFMTAECADSDSEALRADVPAHLDAAARHLIETNRFGLAVWDAHQAVEKTLKLLIRQQGQTPPNIHELTKLWPLVLSTSARTIGAIDFSGLPSGKDAVAARYGEGVQIAIGDAYSTYRSALSVVSSCTEALAFKYKIADSRMTIRKPKFMPYDLAP